jgi:hypothetical protein
MHVELHQRLLADAAKPMNFSCLDDEDIARAGLELHSVHDPETASLPYKLDLIVRVAVRAGAPSRQGTQQEHGDVYVPVIGPDELVGAALEREVILSDAKHCEILR